jgi:hypothetical protein
VSDTVLPQQEHEHFDVDHDFIAHLNGECLGWAGMDGEALQQALQAQGEQWYGLVTERCPHLFAAAPVFISELQLQQMRAVIAAAEAVAGPGAPDAALGVFYGYDFHLNEQGVHLIEINTNAGGGLLGALLTASQHDAGLYGAEVCEADLEQVFLEMFLNEWRRERGDAPLGAVAIVDEQPEQQYLYPEFLLVQAMFERVGIAACIVDPAQLEARTDGLYHEGTRIDLVYNRLTDFTLQRFPHLLAAWQQRQLVLTPNPDHHARHADKHRLALLSDAGALRQRGVTPGNIDALKRGVPETRIVRAEEAAQWWDERKQWFFKPASGYGSKGAYRGDKMTKRVFEEVVHSDYVAQRLAQPGERKVCPEGMEPQSLKYDVRCYVYEGKVQLVLARLYQGQTTNFRTPGGGFGVVRVVE